MKKIVFSLFIVLLVNTIHAQSDSTLKEYTGLYVFPEGGVIADVTVLLEGDQLSMISSAGTSSLIKQGIDSFTIVEFSGLAIFKRSEAKSINAVHIDAAGYIMDGVKQEKAEATSFFLYRNPDYALNKRIFKF